MYFIQRGRSPDVIFHPITPYSCIFQGQKIFENRNKERNKEKKIDLRYYATPPDAEQAVSIDQM